MSLYVKKKKVCNFICDAFTSKGIRLIMKHKYYHNKLSFSSNTCTLYWVFACNAIYISTVDLGSLSFDLGVRFLEHLEIFVR